MNIALKLLSCRCPLRFKGPKIRVLTGVIILIELNCIIYRFKLYIRHDDLKLIV